MKAFTVWDWIVTTANPVNCLKPWSLTLGLYLQNGQAGSAFPTRSVVWLGCTLSAKNPAYNNQLSTRQCLAHDNSFIAAGLKRFSLQANRVAGYFAAASYEAGRMPELFAGLNASRKAFLFLTGCQCSTGMGGLNFLANPHYPWS